MNSNIITIDEIEFPVITYKDLRVVTTEVLAKAFGTGETNIKANFSRNKDRFIEGKHFFKLVGDELKNLQVTLSNLQIGNKTRHLTLSYKNHFNKAL